MKDIIDNHQLDISCDCGHKLKERLGRLKKNPDLICSKCQRKIVIDGNEIRRLADELQKQFSSLGGTLNIKF